MSNTASGRKAYIIDDRSGFKIPYRHSVKEWTGLRVHRDEVDQKHPQLTPSRRTRDRQSLRDPRPDRDSDSITVSYAPSPSTDRQGQSLNLSLALTAAFAVDALPTSVVGILSLGNPTVIVPATIVAVTTNLITSSIGTISILQDNTVLQSSAGLLTLNTGSPSFAVVAPITGNVITSAVGTPVIEVTGGAYNYGYYNEGYYNR